MFSTKLNNNGRFVTPCIIVAGRPIKHSFVVDTGAKYTCCNIYNINPLLDESFFMNAEHKLLGGFVHGGVVKYYKYRVKQFTVGNINLESQDIWITFDERATDDVLGMDMLNQIYFMYAPTDQVLTFSNNKDEFKNLVN